MKATNHKRTSGMLRRMVTSVVAVLIGSVFFSFLVPASEADPDTIAEKARDVLIDCWNKKQQEDGYLSDRLFLDIKNTRVVELEEEPLINVAGDEVTPEGISGMVYLVEFLFYSNYMGDSYPVCMGIYDTVAVYSDGHMEAQNSNPLQKIRARYYLTDFTGVVKNITDLGGSLNITIS